MKYQLQLRQLKPKPQVPNISSVDLQTRKNVLRLLNKQNCIKADSQSVGGSWKLYIDPLSGTALCWYILFLAVFYIVELQISMSLAFGPHFFQNQLQLSSSYFPIYVSILSFLGVDMILSFFRGYYAYGKGKIVENPKKIVLHHLKTQFAFDFISFILYIVPLAFIQYETNFLQLIPGILFWIKKFKYQSQIQSILQHNAALRAFFLISVLFLDVLMVGNYGACLFIGIDLLLYRLEYYGVGETSPFYWLTDNSLYSESLINGPWYFQYIYGQAFSTGTLSTLAPGPFAKNPWEVYASFVMIFFMLLASYVAEVLISILYTDTERRIFHEENIISFDNLMQIKQVDKTIRNRIYNFFQLIWEIQLKMETQEQETMLHKLPTYLKEELLLEIGFTKHLHFLQELSIDNNLKKMVSLKMQRSTIDSNACLFESGRGLTGDQRKVFHIKEGMAKFYLPQRHSPQSSNSRKEKVLSLSNVSKVLGAYEFVTGQSYAMCCKSIDLCLIQSLRWSDFWEIVSELQIEEQFQEMKHRVLYQRQLSHIDKLCVICLSQHVQSQCPDIYPRFSLLNKVRKGDFKSQNVRKMRKRKRVNCRKQLAVGFQNVGLSSIFNLMPNIDLGNLLLQVSKLDKSYESELQQIAFYSSYFKTHNIYDLQ